MVKNNHEKEHKKIAVDNFDSSSQKGDGHEDGGQDFILKTRSTIALLKNIMIRGVQMTERRHVRRLWTERR